ncbi:alanine racemase [Humibacillus sp. DSM 29435]|uniref:alanine racemase n=1 Tax=Humibacillus sp. DSM 29435 TaxID=1869167 RepID=UPI00087327EA|nr:alanine racemase [Humibacillus sp. DSM 29435]OFE15128.1 alanine racemase [Humibacillus sp. DSM 29435]
MSSGATGSVAGRLNRATALLPAPLAVVDLDAFDRNADTLVGRAHGHPIRVATKSLRSRPLIERALGRAGFEGLMCYSVREALWWARSGHDNIMVAYPSVDVAALTTLAGDHALTTAVTVMIDSVEHVDFLAREVAGHEGLRVAVDVDASLRVAGAHLGVRRSPTRTPGEVETVIRRALERGLHVVGLMFYDAQIAGLPDSSIAVRRVKAWSDRDLRDRRTQVVSAARALTRLDFVNGGGTGSLEVTGKDPSLTELAAGSGLYAPTLFDGYDGLDLVPAAFFATPVVRRPAEGVVTTYGGGYVASGPPGWSRVATPVDGQGLALTKTEGTGEVQTPLRGRAGDQLSLGDRVWFRHAKAGELAERFTDFALLRGDEVVGTASTYRGEGQCFG